MVKKTEFKEDIFEGILGQSTKSEIEDSKPEFIVDSEEGQRILEEMD